MSAAALDAVWEHVMPRTNSDEAANRSWERIRDAVLAGYADDTRAAAASLARMRDDLRAAWRVEVGDREQQLVTALDESGALTRLRDAVNAGLEDFDVVCQLGDRDPAVSTIDLLGFLGRQRDEVLHTQALESLMGRAPFRAELVKALLVAAKRSCTDAQAASAKVTSEVSISTRRRDRRIDLVIRSGDLLVVIENKIDAKDTDRQLDDYLAWAHEQSANPLLLYLTPRGDTPTQAKRAGDWTHMSYMALLTAWRRVLGEWEGKGGEWVDVLRLYLATLARHVCRIHLDRPMSLAERRRVIDYLRVAKGA